MLNPIWSRFSVFSNRFDILIYLKSIFAFIELSEYQLYYSIYNKNFEMFEWLLKENCPMSDLIYDACNWDKNLIEFLYNKGCPYKEFQSLYYPIIGEFFVELENKNLTNN